VLLEKADQEVLPHVLAPKNKVENLSTSPKSLTKREDRPTVPKGIVTFPIYKLLISTEKNH